MDIQRRGAQNIGREMTLDEHEGKWVSVAAGGSSGIGFAWAGAAPMLNAAASLFARDGEARPLLAKWGAMHPMGRVARPEEVLRRSGSCLARVPLSLPARSSS